MSCLLSDRRDGLTRPQLLQSESANAEVLRLIPTFQVFERLVTPELRALDIVSKSLSSLKLLYSDQMLMCLIIIDFTSPAGGEEQSRNNLNGKKNCIAQSLDSFPGRHINIF